MRAYLFGWNPIKFKWKNIDEDIRILRDTGKLEDDWSVVSHKTIQPGDCAYFVRVGLEPKGLFASGHAVSTPYLASRNGRPYYRIKLAFDVLLNPDKEILLAMDVLRTGNLAQQNWTPQASGISIRPQLVEETESVWLNFLADNNKVELL